jgi:DnaJ-class molecular chaperone
LFSAAADVLGMADFYQRLGVSQRASQSEIRKQFRTLARRYHPDRNPDDTAAEAQFVEINEAHATLADPERRRKYDQLLRLEASHAPAGGTFRAGPRTAQDFDQRLFHQGSRVFRMGNFADILSTLDDSLRAPVDPNGP